MLHYRLEGRTPVPEPNTLKFAQWFMEADRRVACTMIKQSIDVSTVFLGLNHQFGEDSPPILFETMVFGGRMDQHQERCSTWEEAEQMHAEVVRRVCAAESATPDDVVGLPATVPVKVTPNDNPTWHERLLCDD